jgi:hypothetical protein
MLRTLKYLYHDSIIVNFQLPMKILPLWRTHPIINNHVNSWRGIPNYENTLENAGSEYSLTLPTLLRVFSSVFSISFNPEKTLKTSQPLTPIYRSLLPFSMVNPLQPFLSWNIRTQGSDSSFPALEWGPVVDLGCGFWSFSLLFSVSVKLLRFLPRIEDLKTLKSQFGPNGPVAHCFWKLGTLHFFSNFFIGLELSFFVTWSFMLEFGFL